MTQYKFDLGRSFLTARVLKLFFLQKNGTQDSPNFSSIFLSASFSQNTNLEFPDFLKQKVPELELQGSVLQFILHLFLFRNFSESNLKDILRNKG
jgi:hypothetical protein